MNPNDPAYDYGGRARDDEARAAEQAEYEAHQAQHEREMYAHQAIEFAIETLGFDAVILAAVEHRARSHARTYAAKGAAEALDFARHNTLGSAITDPATVRHITAIVMGDPRPAPDDEPF